MTIGPSTNRFGQNSKLSKEERQFLDDYKAEVEVGRNMAGRLMAFYGEYLDPGLTEYLNQVARYVADNGDYPDRRYMVAVLEYMVSAPHIP